jgi:dipeptidyl-peptidase-3
MLKTGSIYSLLLERLYPEIETEIFSSEKPYATLTFPHEGGITGYFSRNMTSDDLKLVRDFLKSEGIDALNTRVFKRENMFEVTVGSVQIKTEAYLFNEIKFEVRFGEFAPYLAEMNLNLKRAIEYAANET